MKKHHDQRIEKREFAVDDLVLLLNSRLHFFLPKSKLIGQFLITKVLPHGEVELENKEVSKIYLGYAESVHEMVQAYHLDDV